MNNWGPRILIAVVGVAVLAGLILAMMPKPVMVDVAIIERGPLVVTISDDGRTRIRERYVVSAPLSGRLVRINLDPGDSVVAKETLLTTIEPTDPALLDPRAASLAKARVKAAETRVNLAAPKLESAKENMELQSRELERQEKLAKSSASTEQMLDQQSVAYQLATNDFSTAKFELEISQFELEQAKAALLHTDSESETSPSEWAFSMNSPISGQVLRVFQESSTIVNAGEKILELGDPNVLEIEVDVLSTDAVKIRPSARVILREWGGDETLAARVRRVEPSAFTKISALGIEEQRVNVIIDFVDLPADRPSLGDGFRVEADIVHWETDDVLIVPTGALFRESGEWAVFVIRESRAELRHVVLGHRNDDEAEVLEGLEESDSVILYPGDRIESGTLIGDRDASASS